LFRFAKGEVLGDLPILIDREESKIALKVNLNKKREALYLELLNFGDGI